MATNALKRSEGDSTFIRALLHIISYTCKIYVVPGLLGVADQEYYVRFPGAKSLTGFKLCTTPNKILQHANGRKNVTSNNVGSCWPTICNVASVCTGGHSLHLCN